MRAVLVTNPGGVESLELLEVPSPELQPHQLLVRNFAAAMNRADILQRRGLYPPPEGESEILGLEFAGEVARAGQTTTGFTTGDRVFGLVGGGAYAEFLAVDSRLALPIPDNLSFEAAAAVPEAFCIAGEVLFTLGALERGQTVLVHAGASGVGTAVLQLAAERGATVIATTSSAGKLEHCLQLGAAVAVHHREEDFSEAALRSTNGVGVDLIVDLVGAAHWEKNSRAIRVGGRWVLVGLLGGRKAAVDLGLLLQKRIHLMGTTLRNRPMEEKIAVTRRLEREVLPLLEAGRVRPVIDQVFMLEDVRKAHERMEANRNTGKIILRL